MGSARGALSRGHVAARHPAAGAQGGATAVTIGYLAATWLLGEDLVGAREGPRARDVEDVRVRADVGGEALEGRGQAHDADRRLVEDLVPRRAVDLDALHLAVGLDGDGELQRPVELARLGFLGIVEVADALDLEAPVVDVLREAILGGA